MPNEITDAEAIALVGNGWHHADVHIGGRGYVTRISDGKHTYEQSGIDRWYLVHF